MIFDRIENLRVYRNDLRFIEEDLAKDTFVQGKYEIQSSEYFGIGLEYKTRNAEEHLWEAHRKYLDIHILLEGEEYIYISDIDQMVSSKEYEDDYELFSGDKQHSILMKPGYFLILFPGEVHKTGIMTCQQSRNIRKIVFKKQLD